MWLISKPGKHTLLQAPQRRPMAAAISHTHPDQQILERLEHSSRCSSSHMAFNGSTMHKASSSSHSMYSPCAYYARGCQGNAAVLACMKCVTTCLRQLHYCIQPIFYLSRRTYVDGWGSNCKAMLETSLTQGRVLVSENAQVVLDVCHHASDLLQASSAGNAWQLRTMPLAVQHGQMLFAWRMQHIGN